MKESGSSSSSSTFAKGSLFRVVFMLIMPILFLIAVPMENVSLDATPERSIASSALTHHQMPFTVDTKAAASLTTPQAIRQLTGLEALRGRAVIFFPDSILGHSSSFALRMNLFPDVTLMADFQAPSVIDTNAGVFVGTIEGDADGEFRLMIDGSKMSGTIYAFHHNYQIVPISDRNHLILELTNR